MFTYATIFTGSPVKCIFFMKSFSQQDVINALIPLNNYQINVKCHRKSDWKVLGVSVHDILKFVCSLWYSTWTVAGSKYIIVELQDT